VKFSWGIYPKCLIEPNIKENQLDMFIPDQKTQPEEYKKFINEILSNFPPKGTPWKKEAQKLNNQGIQTVKGLKWTNENLRVAVTNFNGKKAGKKPKLEKKRLTKK